MGECESIRIDKCEVNNHVGWYLHLGIGSGRGEQLHGIAYCPYCGAKLWD